MTLDMLFDRARGCFATEHSWAQARAYVEGLLSREERKNGWTLAERVNDPGPQRMQRLLNLYSWDADGLRDVVRTHVVEQFGESGGVLIFDETGFIKKGKRSAGVQRQYSGTAGRIENCQLGVFAVYASTKGHAFVDRELYLPVSWTHDRARRDDAGIPAGVGFATKPALAIAMARRFHAAYPQLGWVAGDEVYGGDPALRAWLEEREIGYVLAVKVNTEVTTAIGRRRVDTLAGMVPDAAWETSSCADGSKGPRLYDWALIATTDGAGPGGRRRDVLVRRSRDERKELAFYLTHNPRPVTLAELVTVAGRRWPVEECFQTGKNEVGLDHYQVRLYHAWYRHITLSMLAHAWLATIARTMREKDPAPTLPGKTAVMYERVSGGIVIDEPTEPGRNTMIPLTLNEIRHIISHIWEGRRLRSTLWLWSTWRRRHQALARYYHFIRHIKATRPSAAPAAAT